MATALRHPKSVRPNDTIWLRGGTYNGAFTSTLNGTRDAPITVRQYPGERAILDGSSGTGVTLTINGSWTWFQGFEVMSSSKIRQTNAAGSTPSDINKTAVFVFGPNTKLINLIVHDTGDGVGFWTTAIDAELYGNIIFSTGWAGPDRGHGHAIYAQNDTGLKLIRDNILFNQFGYNMHIYGTGRAKLKNFRLQGNISFNGTFLIGGGSPAENISLIENHFYGNGSPIQLYYSTLQNRELSLFRNVFAAPVYAFWWDHVTALGNTFYRPGGGATLDFRLIGEARPSDHLFDRNIYPVKSTGQLIMGITGGPFPARKDFTLAGLREMGFESNGKLLLLPEGKPAKPDVFVRPNEYDSSRAHIVVYNWPRQDTVDVDLSAMNLQPGDAYELRNAQNYLTEGLKATYSGHSIRVPMTGWTIATPVGLDKPLAPSTFPEFGVFVLTVTRSSKVTTASAASYTSGKVAAGSIAAVFGAGLAAANTTVAVTDAAGARRQSPLFSVSPTQVNYLIPPETAEGPARVTVTSGASVADGTVVISATAPGLFAANGNGAGVAAGSAVRVDAAGIRTEIPVYECAQLPSTCVPVALDLGAESSETVLTVYGTGIRNCGDWSSFYALIGGRPADVLNAGPHPTATGLDQVNMRLSHDLAQRGLVDVRVMLDDQVSNAVDISIK